MAATEVDEMADEFNPAEVDEDFVMNVATKAQANAVLKHYGMPEAPSKWKLSDVRKLAVSTMRGHTTPREEAPAEPEPEPEPASAETAVEVHDAAAVDEGHRPDAVAVIPDASKWQQIVSMSVAIKKSNLCPVALKTPEDVAVVLLAANDLGIPLTQALDKIFVLDGKKGMAAELMIALVLRDGHTITPDPANDATRAVVHCRRRDTGAEAVVSFTIEDAVAAKLVKIVDGKPQARDSQGRAKPWEKFTADMLWARAVSRACRRMFPDCLAGVSYTPDELGYIDADDEPVPTGRNADAPVSLDQRRAAVSGRISEIRARCAKLEAGAEIAAASNNAVKAKNLPKISESGAAALRAWEQIADDAEAKLDEAELLARGPIDEAETVEEADVVENGPESGAEGAAEPDDAPAGGGEPGNGSEASGGSQDEADEVCGSCFRAIEPGQDVVRDEHGNAYHAGHEPF